mgnify:CR=1 FL=1
MSLDAKGRSGFVDYSFHPYKECGGQSQAKNYLLCVIGPTNQKYALFLDRSANNKDDIDKKIAQIAQLPEIDNVSVYKNFIYLSPNMGPATYRDDINGYGYDANVQIQISRNINRAIDRIGVDRSSYQIINSFEKIR